MISHLKRQFHGTRGLVAQIVKNTMRTRNLGSFIKENTIEPPIISTFVNKSIIGKRDKGLLKVENYSFVFPLKKNPALSRHLVRSLNLEDQEVYQAQRMLKDDVMFHSVAYKWKG